MTCSLLVREAPLLFHYSKLMISLKASFQTSQASWRHSPMPWCNSNSNNNKWWWWTWCKEATQWWWISSMGNSKPPCLIAWAGALALITTPWAWWVCWDNKTIRTISEEWEVKVSEPRASTINSNSNRINQLSICLAETPWTWECKLNNSNPLNNSPNTTNTKQPCQPTITSPLLPRMTCSQTFQTMAKTWTLVKNPKPNLHNSKCKAAVLTWCSEACSNNNPLPKNLFNNNTWVVASTTP